MMQNHPENSEHEQFNVLVLGETQSGKSTLIEGIKRYANPEYQIDVKIIGNGYDSFTKEVRITPVPTNLPNYYVVKSTPGKGATSGPQERVDYNAFIYKECEDDYEDSINQRREFEMIQESPADMVRGTPNEEMAQGAPRDVEPQRRPNNEMVCFNLMDTPGLNATNGEDELHVEKIFSALIGFKKIHLVLITVSLGPFSQGFRDAIKCYVDMFPDFNGIIAFVHTHIDYKNLHPKCEKFSKSLQDKIVALNNIVGRQTVPHFKIDCDLFTKKPIRNCITQNIIRRILQLAKLNNPVVMNQTVVNKTRKMRDIDNLLKDKYEATTRVIERTLRFKDEEEGNLLARTFELETDIIKMKVEKTLLGEFLRRNDTDSQDLLYEERFDSGVIGRTPDKEQTIGLEEQEFTIDQFKYLKRNGIIQHPSGMSGISWKASFKPTPHQDCLFHVKLYVRKSNRHKNEIHRKNGQNSELETKIRNAIAKRDDHAKNHKDQRMRIQKIVDDHDKVIRLLGRASNEILTPEEFQQLIKDRAYIGTLSECAKAVEAVYRRTLKINDDE
ncbi:hypothetical protein BGX20_007365 [Mortierella sp. AD010]|nr:hypothetical protein BGX20_007365 [Mortierella sp. AD010]